MDTKFTNPRDLARELVFPPDFAFGTSTASYQIEGAVSADGREESIWDTFVHTPGKVIDNTTGDTACDHYHLFNRDVELMRQAGLKHYRLSLAWPRILTAAGTPNQAGIDFYNRVLDALAEADIEVMATLYHWDLPQAMQEKGGWLNPETTAMFLRYARVAYEAFHDRVKHWIPINEPNVHTLLGHAIGIHAPGLTLGYQALGVGHALNLAHGETVRLLHGLGAQSVGCAPNHTPVYPADTENPMDVQMAGLYDAIYNDFFASAMLKGTYPQAVLDLIAQEVNPETAAAMSEQVKGACEPLEFYGINYYEPAVVVSRLPGDDTPPSTTPAAAPPLHADNANLYAMPDGIPFTIESLKMEDRTSFDWAIYPEGLTEILVQLRERYGSALPPIIVTEGGAAFTETVTTDDSGQARVHDPRRIDYLARHFQAVAAARQAGVNVAGYYVWSLLDNFEWADGETQRFGLIYTDFATADKTRIPKDSYYWYRDLIAQVGQQCTPCPTPPAPRARDVFTPKFPPMPPWKNPGSGGASAFPQRTWPSTPPGSDLSRYCWGCKRPLSPRTIRNMCSRWSPVSELSSLPWVTRSLGRSLTARLPASDAVCPGYFGGQSWGRWP